MIAGPALLFRRVLLSAAFFMLSACGMLMPLAKGGSIAGGAALGSIAGPGGAAVGGSSVYAAWEVYEAQLALESEAERAKEELATERDRTEQVRKEAKEERIATLGVFTGEDAAELIGKLRESEAGKDLERSIFQKIMTALYWTIGLAFAGWIAFYALKQVYSKKKSTKQREEMEGKFEARIAELEAMLKEATAAK